MPPHQQPKLKRRSSRLSRCPSLHQIYHEPFATRGTQAAQHAIAPAEAQLAAAKAEMEAAVARFKSLEHGLQKARDDLQGHSRAVADAHKKKEVSAADEKRKNEEEVCNWICLSSAPDAADRGMRLKQLQKSVLRCGLQSSSSALQRQTSRR